MIVEFDKEYLAELYTNGKCKDKKHRYQPEIIKGYRKCISYLMAAKNTKQLYPIKSLNYETLIGDKKGISSIRINKQYRLEFTVLNDEDETIITICILSDITNHYTK